MRITAEDMLAAHRLAHRRSWWRAVLPAALGLPAIVLLFVAPPAMQPWLVGAVSLMVGGELARVAIDRFWVPGRLARLHEQHRALHESIDVYLSPDGLAMATTDTRTRLPWSHVQRWYEGPGHLVLMQTDALCVVLPKRDLDGALIDDLRALLVARVGPVGRRRR